MPTREAVFTALLTKLSRSAQYLTVSRRLDFDPALGPTPTPAVPDRQPALYLLESDEDTTRPSRGAPPKRIWTCEAWIWAKIPQGPTPGVPDGQIPGATVINPLIEAIEAALAPDNPVSNVCTLVGLVDRVWIEGRTIKVPGDMNGDGQCFAAVPISILVP